MFTVNFKTIKTGFNRSLGNLHKSCDHPPILRTQKNLCNIVSVRPQMVDFGSEQGLSNFETGGVAGYVERA
jgi:hypothetical protein